jgi:hypothetical protein
MYRIARDTLSRRPIFLIERETLSNLSKKRRAATARLFVARSLLIDIPERSWRQKKPARRITHLAGPLWLKRGFRIQL